MSLTVRVALFIAANFAAIFLTLQATTLAAR